MTSLADIEIPGEWCGSLRISFEGGDVRTSLNALRDYCQPGYYPTNWQMHILLFIICHQPSTSIVTPTTGATTDYYSRLRTRSNTAKEGTALRAPALMSANQSKKNPAIASQASAALQILQRITFNLSSPSASLTPLLPTPSRGSSYSLALTSSYEFEDLYPLPYNARSFVRDCTGGMWDMILEDEKDARTRSAANERWARQEEERKERERLQKDRRKRKKKAKKRVKRTMQRRIEFIMPGRTNTSPDNTSRSDSPVLDDSSSSLSSLDGDRRRKRPYRLEEDMTNDDMLYDKERAMDKVEEEEEEEEEEDDAGEVVRPDRWGLLRWLADLWGMESGQEGKDHSTALLAQLCSSQSHSDDGIMVDLTRVMAAIRSVFVPAPEARALVTVGGSREKKMGGRAVWGKVDDPIGESEETDSEEEEEDGIDGLESTARAEMIGRRPIARSLILSLHHLTQTTPPKLPLATLISQLSNMAISLPAGYLSSFVEELGDLDLSNGSIPCEVLSQALRKCCRLGGEAAGNTGQNNASSERIVNALGMRLPGRSGSLRRKVEGKDDLADDVRRIHILKLGLIEYLKHRAEHNNMGDTSNRAAELISEAGIRAALWPFGLEETDLMQESVEAALVPEVRRRIEWTIKKLAQW